MTVRSLLLNLVVAASLCGVPAIAAAQPSSDDLLDRLAQPGAPFRTIALEQKALAHLAAGDRDAAVEALRAILDSPQATPGLRQRATQMMVTLGEDPRAT